MEKKLPAFFFLFSAALVFAAGPLFALDPPGRVASPDSGEKLILEGVPVKIQPLVPPATADAVQDVPGFNGLRQVVTFKLTRIVQGTFRVSSKEQERPSVKKILKTAVLKGFGTKEYDRATPAGLLEKSPFDIAVTDAGAVFDMVPEVDLENSLYRLYFKHYHNEPTTLILLHSERIPADGA